MRRGVAWVTQALAVALLAGAATAQAQVPISIDDARVPERSGGPWDLSIAVHLPFAPASDVTVAWTLVAGSATAPSDFSMVPPSGTLTFSAMVEDTEYINVQINGDMDDEWTLPLTVPNQDEVFYIQLSNPSANAYIQKGRATITLIDDDRSTPGLQFLAAVSRGNATAGENKLLWRVPAAPTQPTDILIRWNTGSGCVSPASTTAPLTGLGSGQGFFVTNFGYTLATAGAAQAWPHTGLQIGVPYCYSLFAYYGATPSAELAIIQATPFDATAPRPVAWTYSTGFPNVVPPTVGLDGVYTVSTDGVVHAMLRGESGGTWPAIWNPVALGKPAHNRSPVVPLPEGSRFFVGTENGEVHAVDTKSGALVWSRSQAFVGTPPLPGAGGVQATPAGIFKAFGGLNDMILVGTNVAGTNTFFALDPAKGTTLASYPDVTMGNVTGMAVVDYAGNRVFFATTSTSATLFGLDLGPAGSPSLSLPPMAGGNPKSLGVGTNGSVVLRNGRLYLGTIDSTVRAVRLSDGVASAYPHGDGEVKGFVFPDRRNGDIYFSTTGKVWAVSDTLEPANPNLTLRWSVDDIPTPSIVLHRPGTDFLYVGAGNGRLYQIDVASADPKATKKFVDLEPGSWIGAPSLDVTHNLVLVGSASGVVYAVRVPLQP